VYIEEHGDLLSIRKPNNNRKIKYSENPNICEDNDFNINIGTKKFR